MTLWSSTLWIGRPPIWLWEPLPPVPPRVPEIFFKLSLCPSIVRRKDVLHQQTISAQLSKSFMFCRDFSMVSYTHRLRMTSQGLESRLRLLQWQQCSSASFFQIYTPIVHLCGKALWTRPHGLIQLPGLPADDSQGDGKLQSRKQVWSDLSMTNTADTQSVKKRMQTAQSLADKTGNPLPAAPAFDLCTYGIMEDQTLQLWCSLIAKITLFFGFKTTSAHASSRLVPSMLRHDGQHWQCFTGMRVMLLFPALKIYQVSTLMFIISWASMRQFHTLRASIIVWLTADVSLFQKVTTDSSTVIRHYRLQAYQA